MRLDQAARAAFLKEFVVAFALAMRYFFKSFSASLNLARMSWRVKKISAAPLGLVCCTAV